MEHKNTPSNKKLTSIHEEKLKREVYFGSPIGASSRQLPFLLDLEIQKNICNQRQTSQRVLVTVKPRAPAIKTLYIAEKNRFHSKKRSEKSGSILAIGDHSSFATNHTESGSHQTSEESTGQKDKYNKDSVKPQSPTLHNQELDWIDGSNDVSSEQLQSVNDCSGETCGIFVQPQINMNYNTTVGTQKTRTRNPNKADIATFMITNSSSEDTTPLAQSALHQLNQRLIRLERKVLKQAMVIRSFDPNVPLSSSDEESRDNTMRSTSASGMPGCSYIQQYSHVPETSGFQKYTSQVPPLSPSKATTLEKEHNSEQYGRDFTTYDGITARGRRQCASVPCKRDDAPRLAADRVHKIRHKLNPVRDYRLMDTVHYLAQGEFAPRDDGIKLTPSREAVLSDIIYEDVCRTHWPNTRLGRRQHPERCSDRCNTRGELQRLIDSMLRERVAHVERRKRRHYRIVKLNHRHENCRPVGKTGDIIVASHKHKHTSEDLIKNDQNARNKTSLEKRRVENHRKAPKSYDKIENTKLRHNRREVDDCTPGPSYVAQASSNREPMCCYHTSNLANSESNWDSKQGCSYGVHNIHSASSGSASKQPKNPRLVIKKEASRRKQNQRESPDLEHFILLPTLVVRTPSNMKRQKKFNELYHRILNNAQNSSSFSEAVEGSSNSDSNKKDIGFNIHITLSQSTDEIKVE